MDRTEQIRAMASIMRGTNYDDINESEVAYAEALYAAGYRKLPERPFLMEDNIWGHFREDGALAKAVRGALKDMIKSHGIISKEQGQISSAEKRILGAIRTYFHNYFKQTPQAALDDAIRHYEGVKDD